MLSKELMAASTRPLILTILNKGESYGYQIIQDIKVLSGGTLQWSDGMIYPVLNKLRNEEMIESKWVISPEGRKRKYYSITEKGKQELLQAKNQWMNIHDVLVRVWGPAPQWSIS